MATAIEQLEAAGVLDGKNLNAEVKERINNETNQDTVDHLIKFHKTVNQDQSDSTTAPLDPDGGML